MYRVIDMEKIKIFIDDGDVDEQIKEWLEKNPNIRFICKEMNRRNWIRKDPMQIGGEVAVIYEESK